MTSSACDVFFPPPSNLPPVAEPPQTTDRSATSFLDVFSTILPFVNCTVNCDNNYAYSPVSAAVRSTYPIHPGGTPRWL